MVLIPHICHQAVFTAGVGKPYMTGNAFQVRISRSERLKHFILLLVTWLQRNVVFPVSLTVVILIPPEMIRLRSEEHIHIRQALGAEIPCLLPAPERGAEVAVKAYREPLFLRFLQAIQNEKGTVR